MILGGEAKGQVGEALIQPVVDMRHTLADTIAVMVLIDQSREIARQVEDYPFGQLPVFL